MKLKAAARREVADRAAELAVDHFEQFLSEYSKTEVHFYPEELLALQEDIAAQLYKEWE